MVSVAKGCATSVCIVLAVLLLGKAFASVEQNLLKAAGLDLAWLKEIRRELHKIPELKYEESKTAAFVRHAVDLYSSITLGDGIKLQGVRLCRKTLDELHVAHTPIAGTGVLGRIGSGASKFALRADMDGLLITEESTEGWRSSHPGKCHCCGHDSHMAMLLGAAKLLKQRESALRGTILLLFQPAEEGGAGAEKVVKAGALKGVSGIFGIHVWPALPSGLISSKAGVIMAATDKFVVKVRGRGGHGGIPDQIQDTIVAASMAVVALQPLISRETSPTDSGIVGITRFNTGPGSNNIHPEEVELNGTINALSSAGLLRLKQRFTQVVQRAVELYGCTATVDWPQVAYPPTVNDAGLTAMVENVAADLVGRDKWQTAPATSMAAEDFAWLAAAVPGSYVWLGIGGTGTSSGLHTPSFCMNESQLPLGAALHASVALRALALQQHSSSLPDEL